jgi:septum formation protein
MRLILGSASPRRRDLLASFGITPDAVIAPDIDETPRRGESPRAYVERLAAEKARAIEGGADDVILAADTTVVLGTRILGKPADEAEARAFLSRLSGRRHHVLTAIAVRKGERLWQRTSDSIVRLKRLSDAEIAGYLATGDWQGKAGGYAIQGPAGAFIPWISGSYTGIMGLPMAETAALLVAAGYPVWRPQ